jgi:hypothetical protein
MTLAEASDHWVLPIRGREVTQCCIDYAFTLVFWDANGSFSLRIEQPFWFRVGGESDGAVFVPEGPSAELGPVLTVVHWLVERAVAHKDGRLEIDFAEGGALRVPVSNKFEAWNVVGPAGLRVVSLPGGELAVWKPEDSA